MPWRIAYEEQPKIVALDFEGDVVHADVRDSNAAVRAMASEKGARNILTGFTSATRLAISSIDVFKQATALEMAFREAVVCPKASAFRSTIDFYETVCLNRGKSVRVFEQRPEAQRWLVS